MKSEVENAPLLTVYSIFTLAVYGLFALSETLKSLSSSSEEMIHINNVTINMEFNLDTLFIDLSNGTHNQYDL